MKYLPFEEIIYTTNLRPKEVLSRLQENLQPFRTFDLKKVTAVRRNDLKQYEGKVNRDTFEIKRAINYRNSFLPISKGRVEQHGDGSKITVKMRMHTVVLIFMIFWMTVVSIAFLGMLIVKGFSDLIILIPFGMLIFGYLLSTMAFKFESNQTKIHLEKLFRARIENKKQ